MIRTRRSVYAWAILSVLMATSTAEAGSPWYVPWEGPWPWSRFEGSRRIDVIGPIGNRLPESYRRKYNRPTYIGGKIASKIAPSSQEAMSFHRSEELGLYDNNGIKGAVTGQHCPPQRVEQHYFYPKPWEVLTVGPRRDRMSPPEPRPEFEPPGFRELLQETNPNGDVFDLASPIDSLSPSIDPLDPAMDALDPETDQLDPAIDELEPPAGERE